MYELFIALSVTIVLVPIVRYGAIRVGWIHRPNPHKQVPKTNSHPHVVSMGGGLAIFAGIFTVATVRGHSHISPSVLWLAGIALLLGFWDDLKNCCPIVKLIVQTMLGIATVLVVGWIHGLPAWLAIPVTILGVVGLMNAVNFLDNMDGMASGLVALAMLGYAVLGVMTQNEKSIILSFSVAGACFGFWLYNKPPASIFMGDTGSMMLGYLLAVVGTLATHGQYQNELARLVAPLLPAGIFIANTTFVTAWRKAHKLPITFWCLEHNLNYRAIAFLGPSSWKVNVVFYGIQMGLVVLAWGSAVTPLPVTLFLFILSLSGLVGLLWRLWHVAPESVQS